MGKTKDELFRNFSEQGAPLQEARTATHGNLNETEGARQPTGERTFPFAGDDVEYRPPASNLPERVDARTVRQENCDRGNTPWDVEAGEVGPMLAGTEMRSSNTPTAMQDESTYSETEYARNYNPEGRRLSDGVRSAFSSGRAAGEELAQGEIPGNPVEDGFMRLRKLGGGR